MAGLYTSLNAGFEMLNATSAFYALWHNAVIIISNKYVLERWSCWARFCMKWCHDTLFFKRQQSSIWVQETAYTAIKTCRQSLTLMFFKAHFKDNQTSKTCFLCLHHLNTINQNDQSLKNEI